MLTSRTGIEFVDFREQQWTCHHWVRGACLYGIMPANGMIYTPPHPCACYLEAKLYGFNALTSKSAARQELIAAAGRGERLERGPAYDLPIEAKRAAESDDWRAVEQPGGGRGPCVRRVHSICKRRSAR